MAGVTLDQLPPTLDLIGTELFWIYQQGPTEATPWIGMRCTLQQLSTWFANPAGVLGCTMRQLAATLAANDLLVGVLEALTSDVTNQYNIAWTHATVMNATDPFSTGFLQPTLGYTTAQMQELYISGLAFPP